MNTQTITALNQLNKDFYAEVAASFSDTRRYAWKSWQRFFDLSPMTKRKSFTLTDLGCGNGRLGEWLRGKSVQFSYYGIDSSPILLTEAQQLVLEGKFEEKDVVEALLRKKVLFPSPSNCIALFGVFHHIPSLELRQQLFRELAQNLTENGEVWLTAWVPQQEALPVETVCDRLNISMSELERGDLFLGWKESSAVRYVHALQAGEIETLLEGTGLKIRASWQENEKGERGNTCFLLTV